VPLRLALPKGKLLDAVLARLEKAGYLVPLANDGRLSFEGSDGTLYLLLRAQDVPTYCAYGACDAGICGKDTIVESGRDLFEPLDLGIGRCRMVLAAPAGRMPEVPVPRIATKFPRIAESWFQKAGRPAEIVQLYGSVEIAPKMGLADAIVDLVETGRTLAAQNLGIVETIFESTARLVVERGAMRTKRDEIERLDRALSSL
jgi:ATP phosphoribosyltransferase